MVYPVSDILLLVRKQCKYPQNTKYSVKIDREQTTIWPYNIINMCLYVCGLGLSKQYIIKDWCLLIALMSQNK